MVPDHRLDRDNKNHDSGQLIDRFQPAKRNNSRRIRRSQVREPQEITGATMTSINLIKISAAITLAAFLSTPADAAEQSGIASVYSYGRTATGEKVRAGGMTAAHRSLPFGTMVRVTNRRNGQSVVVRINDRGPFVRGRVIDLTPAGAHAIGMSGLAPVSLSVVGRS